MQQHPSVGRVLLKKGENKMEELKRKHKTFFVWSWVVATILLASIIVNFFVQTNIPKADPVQVTISSTSSDSTGVTVVDSNNKSYVCTDADKSWAEGMELQVWVKGSKAYSNPNYYNNLKTINTVLDVAFWVLLVLDTVLNLVVAKFRTKIKEAEANNVSENDNSEQ